MIGINSIKDFLGKSMALIINSVDSWNFGNFICFTSLKSNFKEKEGRASRRNMLVINPSMFQSVHKYVSTRV